MKAYFSKMATKSIVGVVFGLASVIGVSATASAASDFKVIASEKVAMGNWKHHESWRIVRFYLPKNFNQKSDVVLQMNVNSTNKSKYNAIYLNDFAVDEYRGCDPVEHDANAHSRIDYLPVVPHNQWRVYQKTIAGHRFQPGDNYLLVCARNEFGEGDYEIDNFWVKDVVVHYRLQESAPEFCPRDYTPVCGMDGVTYNNACEAAQAQVEIHHGGQCESQQQSPIPGI